MRLKFTEALDAAIEKTLKEADISDTASILSLIDDSNIFKNRALTDSFRSSLISSIRSRGANPKDNPIVRFVADDMAQGLGKLSTKYVNILYDYLINGSIKFGKEMGPGGYNIEAWIFNKKAYTSDYKLNSLLMLSMPNQLKRFVKGDKLDTKNRPFDKVLDANSDREIKEILDEYAPDTEDENDDDDEVDDVDKDKLKEDSFNYFRPMVNKAIADDDLKAIIEKGIKTTKYKKDLQIYVLKEVAKLLKIKVVI